eukprot:COSAG01_NODE_6063_length_3874_cov_5.778278_4_plen_469_part_00
MGRWAWYGTICWAAGLMASNDGGARAQDPRTPQCPNPRPQNARSVAQCSGGTSVGGECKYECEANYSMQSCDDGTHRNPDAIGPPCVYRCDPEQQCHSYPCNWTGGNLVCVRPLLPPVIPFTVTCPVHPPLEHSLPCPDLVENSSCHAQCEGGFEPSGNPGYTCGADGVWGGAGSLRCAAAAPLPGQPLSWGASLACVVATVLGTILPLPFCHGWVPESCSRPKGWLSSFQTDLDSCRDVDLQQDDRHQGWLGLVSFLFGVFHLFSDGILIYQLFSCPTRMVAAICFTVSSVCTVLTTIRFALIFHHKLKVHPRQSNIAQSQKGRLGIPAIILLSASRLESMALLRLRLRFPCGICPGYEHALLADDRDYDQYFHFLRSAVGSYHYCMEDVPHAVITIVLLSQHGASGCKEAGHWEVAGLIFSVLTVVFGLVSKRIQADFLRASVRDQNPDGGALTHALTQSSSAPNF